MGFSFRLLQPLNVIDPEGNALHTTLELSWRDRESSYVRLDSLEIAVSINDIKIWPKTYVPLGGLDLSGGSTTHAIVPLPWTPHIIGRIERSRAATGGVLNVKVDGYLRCHDLVEITLPEQQPSLYLNRTQRFPAAAHNENIQVLGQCPRDQWIGVLKQIRWDDYEIFEIPARRIHQHAELAAGLKRLRQAHDAFRNENWPGTVTECRAAIEAAASVAAEKAGQDGDKNSKAAFESFVHHVFQHDNDEAKRETLSDLMRALRHLRHAGGAHGWDFRLQIMREDAEVALTVATAIFRYVGEAIANRPNPE